MNENDIMNNEVNNETLTETTVPEIEVTAEVAQPSLTKTMCKNGLILGGTAIIGSVVLKVGDAVITKIGEKVKSGATKLVDKVKAKKAEKEAKKEEKE